VAQTDALWAQQAAKTAMDYTDALLRLWRQMLILDAVALVGLMLVLLWLRSRNG
jgi:hypothetical protein